MVGRYIIDGYYFKLHYGNIAYWTWILMCVMDLNCFLKIEELNFKEQYTVLVTASTHEDDFRGSV